VELELGPVAAGADAAFRINNTGHVVDETIMVNLLEVRVQFVAGEEHHLGFSIVNATLEFGDYVKLTGDYTFAKIDTGLDTERTLIGARNVELFLGQGPARLPNESRNPDAVGLLISGQAWAWCSSRTIASH